jgi:hypothetical protein
VKRLQQCSTDVAWLVTFHYVFAESDEEHLALELQAGEPMQLSFFDHIERGRNVFDGFLCHDVASKGVSLLSRSLLHESSSIAEMMLSSIVINACIRHCKTDNYLAMEVDMLPSRGLGHWLDKNNTSNSTIAVVPGDSILCQSFCSHRSKGLIFWI